MIYIIHKIAFNRTERNSISQYLHIVRYIGKCRELGKARELFRTFASVPSFALSFHVFPEKMNYSIVCSPHKKKETEFQRIF